MVGSGYTRSITVDGRTPPGAAIQSQEPGERPRREPTDSQVNARPIWVMIFAKPRGWLTSSSRAAHFCYRGAGWAPRARTDQPDPHARDWVAAPSQPVQ